MSQRAGAVIREYLEAARAGDWRRPSASTPRTSASASQADRRFAGERRGRAAAIEYIETARALAHAGGVTLELVDVLESRDRVALLVRETFRLKDREVVIRRANVYRVQDGRIAEVWIFEGDQYDVDALFG